MVKDNSTYSPKEICKRLNIKIKYEEYSHSTKGYYIKVLGNEFIVLNSLLPCDEQSFVLAHELGHAVLHSSGNEYVFKNCTLSIKEECEKEANLFAILLLKYEIYYSKR